MDIPLLSQWRKRHATPRGFAVFGSADGGPDPAMLAELLGECPMLRARAADDGVELDDSAASLSALDQVVPNWRDDEEQTLDRLGNDAGLYLGTVVVRTVPGATWQVWPNGHPVVRLASGREIDPVEVGHAWAENGSPELSQVLAEVSED
ncbi:DUF6278 family protein [Actinacidiphila bryophytorum]|uniref:Uncharacterized protein n=1 Tax=Actinacidiphila bryophytorum TaxID=1436133 RepID=A0A9W4MG10_9ACTN|nr:DUF6278 family protein [Actinacidiphila bryophytorum]MBM9438549.1 hypothetical protein [Actinacidiphila bryophytorum]MBN6544465.1 hypothetical protein [Actinacidiphila bryophytorum]CAG7653523.1 conserved hypothetical protein [Actinacidiphila bryophytorum]